MDIPDARIERHAVYIGGLELPGFIEEGTVVIKPGKKVNRVTVTFIVGKVDVADNATGAGVNYCPDSSLLNFGAALLDE